jgi:hypothetical protein
MQLKFDQIINRYLFRPLSEILSRAIRLYVSMIAFSVISGWLLA